MKFCFKFPMSNFNSDLSRFKHICNIFHICFYHNSTYNSFIFIVFYTSRIFCIRKFPAVFSNHILCRHLAGGEGDSACDKPSFGNHGICRTYAFYKLTTGNCGFRTENELHVRIVRSFKLNAQIFRHPIY